MEGDPLSLTAVSNPLNGIVSFDAVTQEVTFTPTADFTGTASFDYTVSDGLLSDIGTVVVTVTPENDPPVITSTAPTTATEDVPYTYPVAVTDPDDANNGIDLTFTLTNTPGGMVVSATGVITWTPGEGETTSGAVTVTVADGGEDGAAAATEIFTIAVTAVNDPPVAQNDSTTTAEDTPASLDVVTNDTDVDDLNGVLTVASTGPNAFTQPANGSVALELDNRTFTYTPTLDFSGTDSWTYFVQDDDLAASATPATVTVEVTPVNNAPVAFDKTVTTSVNTQVTITLTARDVDNATLTFAIVGQPANWGTLSNIGNTVCGSGTCIAPVIYAPNTGFVGNDNFTFKVNDGLLDSSPATVTVQVFSDADGDGIEDTIDTQLGIFSNAFNDPTTLSPTGGTIDDRGDRTFKITDEPSPRGVRIFVSLGTLTAQVTVNCSVSIVIQILPNNSYEAIVTCGSASIITIAG